MNGVVVGNDTRSLIPNVVKIFDGRPVMIEVVKPLLCEVGLEFFLPTWINVEVFTQHRALELPSPLLPEF